MQGIPIQSLPNQIFQITLEDNFYSISLRTTNGVMSASITRNGVLVIENVRAVAGFPIIPYLYEEDGNFVFFTQNFQKPDYTLFNITQSLVYLTAAELAAFRVPPTPPLPASFFNPIAALPLRYAPQGYAAP